MNKLYLNKYSPFEHTVFLDADCLVFNNISICFESLKNNQSVFAPIGRNFIISELAQRVGYFDFEKTKGFGIKLTYIFNGGFYYFNKNSDKVFKTAQTIANSQKDYGFPFTGDEPCLALSMAIHNCKCWENPNINGMSWLPRSTNMHIDIENGHITYQFGEEEKVNQADIIHFGTFNTYKPFYKSIVWAIKRKHNNFALFLYKKKMVYACYNFLYFIKNTLMKIKNFISRCIMFAIRKTTYSIRRQK